MEKTFSNSGKKKFNWRVLVNLKENKGGNREQGQTLFKAD